VDEASGYRLYSPDQLERARLVAWLRRIGMPLAKIAGVCDLPPTAVAAEVAAFLRVAEAEFSERKGLAHPGIRDGRFDFTPLGWARYFGQQALADLLEPMTT
jgi:hypothetical protein